MSGMNFFSWLRDGVRQSVLLGVSDAVDQLGVPASEEELHPRLASFLDLNRSDSATPRLGSNGSKPRTSAGRKRLGKSLKDLDAGSGK